MRRVTLVLAVVLVVFGADRSRAETDGRVITPLVDSGLTPEVLASAGGLAEASEFVSLDPLTLADRAGARTIDLGGPSWGAVLSADGSMLVVLGVERTAADPFPKRVDIGVRDAATGALRASYALPYSLNGPSARLSHDGERLVIGEVLGQELGRAREQWHVVDTLTGKTVTTVPPDPEGRWSTETWIDPEARRLYRLLLPSWDDDPGPVGPGPAVIVAVDLTTGAEIGRLEVREVVGGTWDTGRTVGTFPEIGELRPAGALSPDGRCLALVHADADRVTLVDVERLAVERTVSFAPETGAVDRVLAFLSFAPREAAAKVPPVGTRFTAVFAADGRHLYVGGDESSVSDDGTVTGGTLPLRIIDVERGDLVAEAEFEGVFAVKPGADGRGLYVFAAGVDGTSGDDQPSMTLRRVDALTLVVEAERTFAGYPRVLLRPAVPNGSDYHPI